jgi:hypothetical protein
MERPNGQTLIRYLSFPVVKADVERWHHLPVIALEESLRAADKFSVLFAVSSIQPESHLR